MHHVGDRAHPRIGTPYFVPATKHHAARCVRSRSRLPLSGCRRIRPSSNIACNLQHQYTRHMTHRFCNYWVYTVIQLRLGWGKGGGGTWM